MNRALIVFVSVFGAVLGGGCLSTPAESQHPAETTGQELSFSQEYGFCADRCYSEISVDDRGEAQVILRSRKDGTVLQDRAVTLTQAETAELFTAARAAAGQPWDAQYGCPDCADQGRFELAFRDGAAERRTVLDPQDHPAAFDAVVAKLRAVMQRELQ